MGVFAVSLQFNCPKKIYQLKCVHGGFLLKKNKVLETTFVFLKRFNCLGT